MAEYAGNSDRQREADHPDIPEPRATKLVSGRKASDAPPKSGMAKLIDKVVKSETGESLEGYFTRSIADMLCHGVGVIADLISDTISIKLTDKPARSRSRSVGNRVSYRSYYEDEDDDEDDDDDRGYRKKKRRMAGVENYSDVIFDTRGDAEVVLERMYELLDRFDSVSVADLYDMAGISHDYQTNKYGWVDLDGAHVERDGRNYILALPKATSL